MTVVLHSSKEVERLFQDTCRERGMTEEELFEVMVRRFSTKAWLFGLQDLMPFGQYKGLQVESIIRADPAYVRWLCGESDKFDLSKTAQEFLDEMWPVPT